METRKRKKGPYRKHFEAPKVVHSEPAVVKTVVKTDSNSNTNTQVLALPERLGFFSSTSESPTYQTELSVCEAEKQLPENLGSTSLTTNDDGEHESVLVMNVDVAFHDDKSDHNVTIKEGTDRNVDEQNFSSYIPPVNDENEKVFDELWDDLCTVLKEENSDNLVDDINGQFEELTTILNDIQKVTNMQTFCLPKDDGESDLNNEDPDIYPGCETKLGAVVLILCCLMIRFHLPDEAMVSILEVISLILPAGHCMVSSMYKFKKYLQNFVNLPTVQYYCSTCYTHVDKTLHVCPSCGCNLTQSGAVSYFIQLSVQAQIQSMFRRNSFAEIVRNHRFQHYAKNSEKLISDVYDGSLYKNLFENGFLSDPNNISFSMNTDGVPIFKSSHVSMWPVYLLVNELPLPLRKKRENCLFYGVWISAKKTQMWSYLKPLFDELKSFEDGIDLTDCDGNKFTCKATLLTCICDLPARCLVTNSIQFNGAHGCWFCHQKGETYKLPSGGSCHVYPFQNDNVKGPSRTKEDVFEDIRRTSEKLANGEKNYMTRGRKGPFWFIYLKHFDFISGLVIDYMHGICLGVMKTLMTLWFDSKSKTMEYSLWEQKSLIDKRLCSIKPVLAVTRIPRSVDELKHMKSSELRIFLLYWGLPVLNGILPRDHFTHFCLFVRGIFLLSKEKISDDDLLTADQCLVKFCRFFGDLYNDRYYTINLHQLLHLVDSVKASGPLYSNNCFVYEDLNGFILKHIHGTQGVDTQVINTINLIQAVPSLYDAYIEKGTLEDAIYQDLMSGSERVNRIEIEENVFQLGPSNWRKLNDHETDKLFSVYSVSKSRIKCFLQINMKDKGFYVYGSEYARMQRRDQSVVSYKDLNDNGTIRYCRVLCFAQFENVAGISQNVVIASPLECNPGQEKDPIKVVVPNSTERVIFPITCIETVCNFVKVNTICYICLSPNRFDRD